VLVGPDGVFVASVFLEVRLYPRFYLCVRPIAPPRGFRWFFPLVFRRHNGMLEIKGIPDSPGNCTNSGSHRVPITQIYIQLAPLYPIPSLTGLMALAAEFSGHPVRGGVLRPPGLRQPPVLAVGGGQPLGGF